MLMVKKKEKQKNIMIKMNYYLMENILMVKKRGKLKNIIKEIN